jgi:hypothetical protein
LDLTNTYNLDIESALNTKNTKYMNISLSL